MSASKRTSSCASSIESLTPLSITYSNVIRRALDSPGYCRQAAKSFAIGCFRLMGTSSFRNSSRTACREMARATFSSSPVRAIPGTTPDVDNVTRRREKPRPSSSSAISKACLTFSKFNSGSPMPIITMLETLRPVVGKPAVLIDGGWKPSLPSTW